jgi:hypothetical protein
MPALLLVMDDRHHLVIPRVVAESTIETVSFACVDPGDCAQDDIVGEAMTPLAK